ncbi:YitT family protein [Fictibacillus sp. WQ 8-8]|uniref:YitT family protein n=1 Tax=Fictibacillus sp. WQ 8-8 TaxID=2938788 RepID=UPI00210977A9|nr:YitT family protein [Fictibacillus sp. WQ 8-8]MCQ6265881.1 YitT family protein [Fictibacillus sp. WQ 8-8]
MYFLKKALLVLMGLFLTALGTKLLTVSHLTFGGTAGISTLLTFSTGVSWGVWFFVINLPFFILSVKRLGISFSVYTLLCISLISLINEFLKIAPSPGMHPLLIAIVSGLIIGTGVVLVLNNGASLGGIHILAVYMDQHLSINRGKTLFLTDFIIVISASLMVGFVHALYSIVTITIASYLAGKFKPQVTKNDDENDLTIEAQA